MKLILGILLALLVFLLALALGAQNDQIIQVNYLIAQSQLRLSTLMAICFVSGIVASLFFCLLWFMGYRFKARQKGKASQISQGA